jgi:hypothetical protein
VIEANKNLTICQQSALKRIINLNNKDIAPNLTFAFTFNDANGPFALAEI